MAFKAADPEAWLRKFYGENLEEITVYERNTENVLEKAMEAAKREYEHELALHQQIGFLRVPVELNYCPALCMVWPRTILELGVGGNMAVSTAIFLHWAWRVGGHLVSCDRTPQPIARARFGEHIPDLWELQEMDSVQYLESQPQPVDMIFIDTIHTYDHTIKELDLCAGRTDAMLLDDATYTGWEIGVHGEKEDLSPLDAENILNTEPGGVKAAMADWLAADANSDWERVDLGPNEPGWDEYVAHPQPPEKPLHKRADDVALLLRRGN
jgi:hypothetical protein